MSVSYTRVAENLATNSTTLAAYTQAVSMDGANAVQVDVVVFNLGGASSVSAKLEGSNDLENWSSALATYSTLALGANFPSATTAIAWRYVRLGFTVASAGTAVLSAGISTSQG